MQTTLGFVPNPALRTVDYLCGDFLPAVTSIREARSAAEAAKSAHLTHAPGTPVHGSDGK